TSLFECRSKFSDISIGKIDKSLSLDISYGDCEVDQIPPDFTSIRIRNRFGQVSLGIDDQASYTLSAVLQFCDLDYPKSKAHMTDVNEEPTSKSFKGTIGPDQHPKSTVTIDSQYGGVSLK
ncbi:MAG TPA: hypothetical protein VMC08_00580, partial [Bacteroidales bacterium]|nr:hypothetical protein [Bacteroidales bacterium]